MTKCTSDTEKKLNRNSIPLNQQRIVLSTEQMKLEIKCSIPNCRFRAPDSICKLNYHQQFSTVYFHWFFCIWASISFGKWVIEMYSHFATFFYICKMKNSKEIEWIFSLIILTEWKISNDRETSACHNVCAF